MPSRLTAPFLPWQRVHVSGPSMSPTLRDGDVVLVRRGRTPRAGDVVLARFRSMPERPVLKRAQRPAGSGWWLESDNRAAGGASESHGVADVLGVVVVRWRPSTVLPRFVRRTSSTG
jgi:SOS-response transcriptional repressor LexA